MKLLSLSLRGAVGIERGLGLDQIDIDFTAFDAGLVALVAPNGSGKTTILENLHPYRCLVSRPGALQNHFFLRDSHRILAFEMNGDRYEAKLLIDGQTGKQESYLLCNGEPLTDGKTTSYDARVAELFGSEDLFFRSLFRGQGAGSITELKPTQRKTLFVELLGLEHLQAYHEAAKDRVADAERALMALRAEAAGLEARASQLAEQTNAVIDAKAALDAIAAEHAATTEQLPALTACVQTARDAIAVAAEQRKAHDRAAEHLAALKGEAYVHEQETKRLEEVHATRIADIHARIARAEKILANTDTIDKNMAALSEARAEVSRMDALKLRAAEVYAADTTMLDAASAVRTDTEREIARLKLDLSKADNAHALALQQHKAALADIDAKIARAAGDAALLQTVPCADLPTFADREMLLASCAFLSRARASRDELAGLAAERAALAARTPDAADEECYVIGNAIADAEHRLALHVADFQALYAARRQNTDAVGYDDSAHRIAMERAQELQRTNWDALAAEARQAAQAVDRANAEFDAEVTAHRSILDQRVVAWAAIEQKIDAADAELRAAVVPEADELLTAVDRAEQALGAAQHRLAQLQHDIVDATVALTRAQEARAAADCAAQDLEAKRPSIAAAVRETEEWALLVRATGKDGIQALELDAAGPNVSALANQLLADTFGSQFQIAFETTKQSADGKRQLETFDIRVFADGTEQTIENLSGGQRVWIEAALAQAIAIYLRRKSGLDLRTSYLDESDGALDAANAFHYLAMLRRSHELAGTHHTFVITHRQELLALIPQQLRLIPGEGVRHVH